MSAKSSLQDSNRFNSGKNKENILNWKVFE